MVLLHGFCTAFLQVNELDAAVNRAAEQPQRFGLTAEEIASRRKWISATRRQVRQQQHLRLLKLKAAATALPSSAAARCLSNTVMPERQQQLQRKVIGLHPPLACSGL
jgi:anti-sigma factor RsiW